MRAATPPASAGRPVRRRIVAWFIAAAKSRGWRAAHAAAEPDQSRPRTPLAWKRRDAAMPTGIAVVGVGRAPRVDAARGGCAVAPGQIAADETDRGDGVARTSSSAIAARAHAARGVRSARRRVPGNAVRSRPARACCATPLAARPRGSAPPGTLRRGESRSNADQPATASPRPRGRAPTRAARVPRQPRRLRRVASPAQDVHDPARCADRERGSRRHASRAMEFGSFVVDLARRVE